MAGAGVLSPVPAMTRFADPDAEIPLPVADGDGGPLESVDAVAVRAELERSGALLLRNFATTVEGFAGLTDALCSASVFNESPHRDLLDQASGIQSVNKGGDPFPLHPELAREPWRPDVCLFACLGAPGVGGQTNLADGIAIVEGLPAELRRELADRKLIYIKPALPAELAFWLGTERPDDALLADPPAGCPYQFRRQPNGAVLRIFTRPAFERTAFQDAPAWGNFLLFARDYLHRRNIPLLEGVGEFPDEWLDEIRRAARRVTYAHRWQQGDVLVVDNCRFMHGRRAIADEGERRIATSFGYLKGIERRPGEPADPPWRKRRFVPPVAMTDEA